MEQRYETCVITTRKVKKDCSVGIFRSGRSENKQRILQSPPTEIRIIGYVWLSQRPLLQSFTLPPFPLQYSCLPHYSERVTEVLGLYPRTVGATDRMVVGCFRCFYRNFVLLCVSYPRLLRTLAVRIMMLLAYFSYF
jgi:hypothetical protein